MPSPPSQILPFLPQAARKPLVSLVLPYPPFRPPLPPITNTYQYLPALAPCQIRATHTIYCEVNGDGDSLVHYFEAMMNDDADYAKSGGGDKTM